MQVGALPAAILSYDRRIRQRVDLPDLAGVLQSLIRTTASAEPRIEAVERTRAGTLVILQAVNRSGPSGRYSYLLRRDGGGWVIVYDTLIDPALQTYVTNRVQGSINPAAQSPSARAATAGRAAVDAFREAALRP